MTDPKPTPESLESARNVLSELHSARAVYRPEQEVESVARAIDAAREPLLQELREAYANGRKADRELRAQLQDEKDRVTAAAATVESVHDSSLAAGRAQGRRAALEECAEILKSGYPETADLVDRLTDIAEMRLADRRALAEAEARIRSTEAEVLDLCGARNEAEDRAETMGEGHRAWCIALDHAGRGMEPEEMGKAAAERDKLREHAKLQEDSLKQLRGRRDELQRACKGLKGRIAAYERVVAAARDLVSTWTTTPSTSANVFDERTALREALDAIPAKPEAAEVFTAPMVSREEVPIMAAEEPCATCEGTGLVMAVETRRADCDPEDAVPCPDCCTEEKP